MQAAHRMHISEADENRLMEMEADEDQEEPESSALEIGADQFDVSRHNGFLTLHSPTGHHRTLKITTARGGQLEGRRIVSLLTGPNRDDRDNWQGFAFVAEGNGQPEIRVWHKFRGNGEKSQYEKLADLLERPAYWAGRGMHYLLSTRCRRCNRPLTNPSSIMSGLGPYCEGRI